MDQATLYEKHGMSEEHDNQQLIRAMEGRNRFIIQKIKQEYLDKARISIAELSVGDGSLTKRLIADLQNVDVTCVDISSNRLNHLRNTIMSSNSGEEKAGRLLQCNLDTQFGLIESAQYDIVIALDIMEHVFDVFSFLDNCNRILRTRGTLFLRTPNISFIRHRIRLLCGELPVTASWFGPKGDLVAWRDRYGWDGGHLHMFTIPVLYKLLTEAGFTVSECSDPGARYSGLRDYWPNLLYSNPLIISSKSSLVTSRVIK